jgi:hypothetical protein
VTAQAEEPGHSPHTPPIPHTIDAVAAALTGAKRMAFYREIGQAEEGEDINTVLRRWWREAMFDSRPGREQRLAHADAGTHLAPLPDLVGGQE